MTDEQLKKIEKDYKAGSTYKELQEKYNITPNELKWNIQKNKWKRKSNRRKAQKGNKNAKNNKGGTGAKQGNKNAVTTGEYETILLNELSEDERAIYEACDIIDKKDELKKQYKMLSVREFRITKKIETLKQKNKEMTVEYITKHDNIDGTGTSTHATNTINLLQKLDDSLSRIQEQKRKCIDSLHKIETDDRRLEIELIRLEREAAKDGAAENDNITDNSFIEALENSVESTWDDYNEQEETENQ